MTLFFTIILWILWIENWKKKYSQIIQSNLRGQLIITMNKCLIVFTISTIMKVLCFHNRILWNILLFIFFYVFREKNYLNNIQHVACLYYFVIFFFREHFFSKKHIPNYLFDFIYQVCKRAESLNLNIHVGYHDIWPGSGNFIKEIFPKKNSIVHFLFRILNIYIWKN